MLQVTRQPVVTSGAIVLSYWFLSYLELRVVLQTESDQIEWLLFTGFSEENVLSLFFFIKL